MDPSDPLAQPFEDHRIHLRGVAYRMLGSLSEADDAVQEAWLRLQRADTSDVANLRGWLTTVVGRICLDMLRARKSRREESIEAHAPEPMASAAAADPEHEVALADSVGLALLVVLDTLNPAERLAFVLHDMFAMSFDEIAPIVGRSPTAARQLASRARRRVQGRATAADVDVSRQRAVVDAFLAALRGGDFEALVAVLDPDVVVRTDRPGAPGAPMEIRGARAWAQGAVLYGRQARFIQPALIDGAVGLILAPRGRLVRALRFVFAGERIAEAEIIFDPEQLQQLDVAVLD